VTVVLALLALSSAATLQLSFDPRRLRVTAAKMSHATAVKSLQMMASCQSVTIKANENKQEREKRKGKRRENETSPPAVSETSVCVCVQLHIVSCHVVRAYVPF
jgi:hypothetical protein